MSLIIGRKPVLEAINSDKQIVQIILKYGQTGSIINTIKIAAKKRKIKVTEASPKKFDINYAKSNTQGIVAKISERNFHSLDSLIEKSKKSPIPFLLILEEIQDVRNAGAILRTAECVNVDGVIITKRNSAPLNETVSKISTGAVDLLKICMVGNLSQTIDTLKKNGFWIIGTTLKNSADYSTINYNVPIALIVGNEERGIRRLTSEKSDYLINIPMSGKLQSLNVSVATGVVLFEIARQRKLNNFK